MQSALVSIELFSTECGGPATPLSLKHGSCRPHLRVAGGHMLGVAFVDGPDAPVAAGQRCAATALLIYSGVDYSALASGATFELLAGARVMGTGRVIDRLPARPD